VRSTKIEGENSPNVTRRSYALIRGGGDSTKGEGGF